MSNNMQSSPLSSSHHPTPLGLTEVIRARPPLSHWSHSGDFIISWIKHPPLGPSETDKSQSSLTMHLLPSCTTWDHAVCLMCGSNVYIHLMSTSGRLLKASALWCTTTALKHSDVVLYTCRIYKCVQYWRGTVSNC